MTTDWCFKCPKCDKVYELEGEMLNHGDGDTTELKCYECGQEVKCTAYVSIYYQFTVKDPVNEDEYNVGLEMLHIFGTDPSNSENYKLQLEDEYEWEAINRILTEQGDEFNDS